MSSLSPVTEKSYATFLARLIKLNLLPAPIVMTNELKAHLEGMHNAGTRKAYLSALLDKLRHAPPEIIKPFRDMFAETRKVTDLSARSQTISPRRETLPWPTILALREKAKKELPHDDYLLFCLYTLNAPVRADYAGMRVVSRWIDMWKRDTSRNYLVLNRNKSYFVFNQYKTSKTMGQVIVPTSPALHEVLSLRCQHADYVFEGSPQELSKAVIRVFKKLCDKNIGIGILRHSFITYYLSVPRRLSEKDVIARAMMHGASTQELYHLFPEDD